ncbi:hypothetical protein LP416_09950 [Polaromonas sp. P2-4]|nr:hypothetical protein LP416_09950 [Polaromonas sp. P2-4]
MPYPPGGTSDNLGRLVAERLGANLGVTVVVDNKPGGTTQVGTEIVAPRLMAIPCCWVP